VGIGEAPPGATPMAPIDAGRAPMAVLLGALIDPIQIRSLIDAADMADRSGILAQLKAESERTTDAVLKTADFVATSLSPELLDRFARLRDERRLVPRRETVAPSPYTNEAQDREIITELMTRLRDPNLTPDT